MMMRKEKNLKNKKRIRTRKRTTCAECLQPLAAMPSSFAAAATVAAASAAVSCPLVDDSDSDSDSGVVPLTFYRKAPSISRSIGELTERIGE